MDKNLLFGDVFYYCIAVLQLLVIPFRSLVQNITKLCIIMYKFVLSLPLKATMLQSMSSTLL